MRMTLEDDYVFIVTVPTPIDNNNILDLAYVESVRKAISIKKDLGERTTIQVVIHEITFYLGATEEFYVPITKKLWFTPRYKI